MTEESIEETQPLSLGKILKQAREEQGVTLDSVAKILCISKRQLRSLEDDSETLVCDVYTIGFLKSYSHFLGLDNEKIVKLFKVQSAHPQTPRLTFPAPLPGRGIPSFRILGFSILAILLVVVGWEWLGHEGEAQRPISTNTVKAPEPEVVIEEVALASVQPVEIAHRASVQEIETITPLPTPEPVMLMFKEDTWIEVRDQKGDVVVSKLFYPGETYEVKSPEDLLLKTGNIGGMEIRSGDKTFHFKGDKTLVQSNIPLDPQKWLEEKPETH
jgi:transcriptional regulator with XRE-family HTH domain